MDNKEWIPFRVGAATRVCAPPAGVASVNPTHLRFVVVPQISYDVAVAVKNGVVVVGKFAISVPGWVCLHHRPNKAFSGPV